MEIEQFELQNGMRFLHIPYMSEVAYCGLIINTGARDEMPEQSGMAHFIEHTIFKGTKKRKAYHVISRMEDVGGELDAYTTKEETYVYSAFLKNDLERAIELISDIMFQSTFPEKELEKEKEVVFDEINSYKDSPSELIFDDFEELVFKKHPIGNNILGTKKTLKKISQKTIKNFIDNNYHTDQMVICIVGQFELKKIKQLTKKYFSKIKPNLRQKHRNKTLIYSPQKIIKNKNTWQAHCSMGVPIYDMYHDDLHILSLITALLGGNALNSRFNLSLREKHGLVYHVNATITAYTDTGLFSVYFGTEKTNMEKAISLVFNEIKKLQTQKMGMLQLSKIKKQLIGQLIFSFENKENLLLNMAKYYLHHHKTTTIEEIVEEIRGITASQILKIANEALVIDEFSQLIYQKR